MESMAITEAFGGEYPSCHSALLCRDLSGIAHRLQHWFKLADCISSCRVPHGEDAAVSHTLR